jgi:hypothetical protein
MMGHNVWMHINSVQEANRQYDAGLCPDMLVDEQFDRIYFKDVVDAIFSRDTKEEADKIIKSFEKFFMSIPGTRGYTGKRLINPNSVADDPTMFDLDINLVIEKAVAKEAPKPILNESLFEF